MTNKAQGSGGLLAPFLSLRTFAAENTLSKYVRMYGMHDMWSSLALYINLRKLKTDRWTLPPSLPPLRPRLRVKGEMPESLCNLYCLQHLNLSYNSGLRGWIPEGLGDLSNLKTLHLYSALLTG